MTMAHSHIVLGLGATGLSVVRFLCAQGITPLVMDSRRAPPGRDELAEHFPQVELCAGGFDCRALVQAEQIIISPGIAIDTPEVQAALDMGIEVIGDIELFARALGHESPRVLAITGSNGKSTVTTLAGEMIRADGVSVGVGGNIGIPALSLLAARPELYVLELSSFQLETTSSLKCLAATCLNISEDHMDRYADLQSYRQAKLRLYRQTELQLVNRDDELTLLDEHQDHQWQKVPSESFGLDAPLARGWGIVNGAIYHNEDKILSLDEVSLIGSHNHANLLAAMALVDKAGISRDAMVKVAKSFTGLAHRCERVAVKNGVTYVNDSKATNVGATLAALDGLQDFPGKLILIAGGDGKGADFCGLTPALSRVAKLITLGKDGDKLAELKSNAKRVRTMAEAVKKAARCSQPGDMVLLSPACASLDMYSNFMARGDDFRLLVEALDGE